MKVLLTVCMLFISFAGASFDLFNYDTTDATNRNFGPADWGMVDCHDVESCPGWPTNWEDFHSFIEYDVANNTCKDCSESDARECRRHKQSPIRLLKNATVQRECKDRHRINFVAGTCKFGKSDFQILPHVLRAYQPKKCSVTPNIDFSWGFPNPWYLSFTDISVPSQHTIEGKRYDAEVVLSHVYSVNKTDKLIGNVVVLLERGNESDHYDFLDLYIRRWRKVQREVNKACQARNVTGQSQRRTMKRGTDVDKSIQLSPKQTAGGAPQVLKKSYFNRTFHPYDWYQKSGTEYYFRYEGSMPEPPCIETVHWRVMKDPVRVAPRQIEKLERLLLRRLNPDTCERDSAGKPRPPHNKLRDVARPLQTTTREHVLVYCECDDWQSKTVNDKLYCNQTKAERGVGELLLIQEDA